MKITTKGRYALRAIINLACSDQEGPLSIKSITDEENLSPIFLEQIFTKLKKAGLITSIRGARGGFLLAKKTEDISVKDILVAVEEGLDFTPCSQIDEATCGEKDVCICSNFWKDANNYFLDYLGSKSIADIIKSGTV